MAATPLEKYRFGSIEPTPFSEKVGMREFRLRPDFDLTSLKPAKDLSKYDSPVQDQKQLNTCSSFVSTAIVEHIAKRNGKDVKCSELYAYYTSRVQVQGEEPDQDTGASVPACIQALETYGDAHEADWPYEESKVAEKPPQEAYDRGTVNQVVKAGFIRPTLNSIRAAIASQSPVFINFTAFKGMIGPDTTKTGLISVPPRDSPWDDLLGAHAMVIVGYDDDSRLVKCKNSWGAQRGQDGYYFLPYEYFDAEWCFDENQDPLKLVQDDCWTVDAMEYESDDVILHDRPSWHPRPFMVSAVGA